MSERAPKIPEATLSFGEYNYQFTPHNGWGFLHSNPDHDHIVIVTEFDDNGKPATADYLFRHLLASQGIDLDDLFEMMTAKDDDWVKGEKELTTGELQALALSRQHNAIASFDLRGENAKLTIQPVSVKKPAEPVKEPELETFELTHRLEDTIRHFGELLLNTPNDLLYDAITTPQKSDLPFRWISSKVIREEEE